MRCFLACRLPDAVRARLAAVPGEFATAGAAVRWTPAGNLHLTLKFLGEVDAARLPALQAAVGAALAGTAPMTAVVRGLGAFPGAQRPRTVWAGVDCPPLARIAAALDAALAPLGFAAEARPFTAHVTLGRVRDPRRAAPLTAALRARADAAFGAGTLTALDAVRSDLRPDGAVYTTLWSIPFGA